VGCLGKGLYMTAFSRIAGCGLLLLAVSGCQTLPTVKDFKKQEHVIQHVPPIHLALRGCRTNRKLTLQVFLLTASSSLWLYNMALKLPDGTILPPKSLHVIDPQPEKSSSVSFGFGIGAGRSSSSGGHGECASSGTSGKSSGFGGVGVGIPIGSLGNSAKPPRSIEAAYELPETQANCKGSELTVNVATEDPKKKKDKPCNTTAAATADTTTTAQPAAADDTQPKTVAVTFVLNETVPACIKEKDGVENKDKDKVKDIVREIDFTLKG